MPPSGFNRSYIKHLLGFVRGFYGHLLEEVESGKHDSVEAALEHEIGLLDKALARLHINENGKLVDRESETTHTHLKT